MDGGGRGFPEPSRLSPVPLWEEIMGTQVQEHRNGVTSIEVEITSIKDKDGKERNYYYGKGRGPGTILNLVEGEARRLIDSGRAKPVDRKEKKAKGAPKAKATTAPNNK